MMSRLFSRRLLRSVLLFVVGTGFGCSGDTTGPAPITSASQYWRLVLNHHAITLALTPPYDTLHLTATPYAAVGTPMTDTGVTTWTTSDSSSVQITQGGVLTGKASASMVVIIASRMIGLVRRADTAVVNVNTITSVPSFAALTLTPDLRAGGLPLYDVFGFVEFVPSALDDQQRSIPNVVFRVRSLTPAILGGATVDWKDCALWTEQETPSDFDCFTARSIGHAVILADATVYGTHRVDTLDFAVEWKHVGVVQVIPQFRSNSRTPVPVFRPVDDTIAVGGTVAWKNILAGPIGIVFDDSAEIQPADSATFLDGFASIFGLVIPAQGGGNIPPFAPLDSTHGNDTLGVRARRFPIAGTYRYHSALYGTSGVIHVLPEF